MLGCLIPCHGLALVLGAGHRYSCGLLFETSTSILLVIVVSPKEMNVYYIPA
jgi:hypothetical protein